MLRSMFGIGGSEILVILVVALLFLGPDKLPEAAKTISKGIRDLKKQSRALQQQIESDEKIGGAIRDLKSALRGEDLPVRPPVRNEPKLVEEKPAEEVKPTLTLPETAGERDANATQELTAEDLGSLIKPVEGTVAKTPPPLPRIVKDDKNG
jgi:sec-independent protein translocase protein TatB